MLARSLVAIVISIAMLRRAGVHTLGNRRWLLLARGVWGYAALSCGFYAVMKLPLAEATMIQYLHPRAGAGRSRDGDLVGADRVCDTLGVLFFGEVPGVPTLLGSLLVILGTAIGARAVLRRQ